ncbi:pirin family protein [Aeromicrobium sp. CFBP 8757]|uniref:pirin family protein n=1 Tax=Aeromicrobium sp. CFBP 8757 TaxID=2775288 RepID=UPI0017844D51|nr:pirin family protein [Aeromicrobium sp. CFBP 8757]MBD8607720.1 pirin family protein [Aeromicrobium sp. CFBP 8757]
MPAVTAADWTVLPRVIATPTQTEDRAPVSVTTAPIGYEGEGFPVHRAFAGVDARQLDPFIHMDQMGEVEYQPGEPKGTPWHPHRGFETVTYMIDGVMDHQDTHGGGGSITDGDTQWMTAGSGLLHIETPPEWLVVKGGVFHGLQLWVNLPKASKWLPPHYQDIRGTDVGLASTPDAGALLRVIAGEVDGVEGPGSTHTPMTMVHATVLPGAEMTVPWRTDFNALVYVMGGTGHVGRERRPLRAGQLAVLGHGETVTVGADRQQAGKDPAMEVVLLGGLPIREPIAWAGPFVMNTKAEVAQAFADFQKGRLGTIPTVPHDDVHGELLPE